MPQRENEARVGRALELCQGVFLRQHQGGTLPARGHDAVRGVDGAALECALCVESLTALLLHVNRNYKAHASIKLTGI